MGLPLGAFLVKHTTTALLASNGIVALQGKLGSTVTTDVVHGRETSIGVYRVEDVAATSTLGAGGTALRRRDLVVFAR